MIRNHPVFLLSPEFSSVIPEGPRQGVEMLGSLLCLFGYKFIDYSANFESSCHAWQSKSVTCTVRSLYSLNLKSLNRYWPTELNDTFSFC